MYRWPQGRIVRLVALALVLLVAIDLAINGAWRGFGTASEAVGAAATRQTIYGVIFTVLSVGVFAVGLWMVGFWKRSVDFLIDIDGEMGRVEWPTWPVLWKTTLVVAIVMVLLGLLIVGVDWLCQSFVSALNALGGGN
jgi:preprotein translocase SecE subunit